MCIIYLLAGAFAVVSKAMGGVDSTVNLGITYIPPHYIAVLQQLEHLLEQ